MNKVETLFKPSVLKKGDYFTKVGQYCDKMSFIQSGYVRIFAENHDKEITQWISTQGFFLADLSSFIFNLPAKRNMQAITDCELFTIHKKDYERLVEIVPNWPEMEKRFLSGCFVYMEDRIFSHLSLSAEERYDKLFKENKEMFNRVPLQYLASMLGMSPVTFSRIRAKKIS
jgi:CRP/FNR family transcriptional regulator, anaerobic regulatory protein